MKSPICQKLGIEFPLFAFSHCRDVVAAVSKAGGFGVLGAVGHTPESLEIELSWIDDHVDGKPYGIDLIVPTSMDDRTGNLTPEDIAARVPEAHKRYVERVLAEHGIATHDLWDRQIAANFGDNLRASGASMQLDTAFKHPIRLVVNALGVPPPFMLDGARQRGILVGALAGSKQHAIKHAELGLDVVIAAGGEAGGHCGEIATMVLVPEIVHALKQYPNVVFADELLPFL